MVVVVVVGAEVVVGAAVVVVVGAEVVVGAAVVVVVGAAVVVVADASSGGLLASPQPAVMMANDMRAMPKERLI